MSEDLSRSERVEIVRERVRSACDRAGRETESVKILPVSKRHSPLAVTEIAACGFSIFGESRIQEAEIKIQSCSSTLDWHMIGRLQGNKVKRAVGLFQMLHSIDSLDLLQKVNRACCEQGDRVEVLLQVNVSGEASKAGFDPERVPAVLEGAASLMGIDVVGLMTMAPAAADPEDVRPVFAGLRDYRDRWQDETGFPLEELSMGMSHDYEIAIEEGATWIRVGSALFGKREVGQHD